MTLKDLAEQKHAEDREKYPSVPPHGFGKQSYSDTTANGLTKAIKAFCDLQGVMCSRTGSEGRYRAGQQVVDVVGRTRIMKGTWLPGLNVGQGDLQIVLKGKVYSVEVKIGKDRQSEVQKEFQEKLERAGGVYVVVKSWREFYEYFKQWTKCKR